jgi:hypothetical protein
MTTHSERSARTLRPSREQSHQDVTQAQRNQAAIKLLQDWRADESGYDEQAWPRVETLLDQNPVAFGR